MVDAYIELINASSNKINGEIFNVGFKNQTVNELANDVRNRNWGRCHYYSYKIR